LAELSQQLVEQFLVENLVDILGQKEGTLLEVEVMIMTPQIPLISIFIMSIILEV
jgi:hypothetical protein